MDEQRLRPIERTILRLKSSGMSLPEIARRVRKRPGTVERILLMIDYKRDVEATEKVSEPLTPLERVVLRLREEGENHGEIGSRLGRSGAQIRRIESYIAIKTG